MRERIHRAAEKIFNTAASEMEEEALKFKRFKQSNETRRNYILFFGTKKYIQKSECSKYIDSGITVYTE